MVRFVKEGKVIEIAIVLAATVIVAWIIQTLVSVSRKDGAHQREIDQANESRRRLNEATKADIDSRKRSDTYGGLLKDDGHKRD